MAGAGAVRRRGALFSRVLAACAAGLAIALYFAPPLILARFGWLVIVPLQYAWWRFLGYFG